MSQDPALVAQLAAWLAGTDIAVLELRGPDGLLRLVRSGDDVRHEIATAGDVGAVEVEPVSSPGVGVFLDRHPLRLEPAAAPGSRHAAADTLGFIRVGPVLRAVPAPCDCLVADVLVPHGSVVGYGTPLFAIVPLSPGETP